MHSIHIISSSVAIGHICRDEAFSLPCSNRLFIKVVRFCCEENVWRLADIEVFEKGLAAIYSGRHCRLRIFVYWCVWVGKRNEGGSVYVTSRFLVPCLVFCTAYEDEFRRKGLYLGLALAVFAAARCVS